MRDAIESNTETGPSTEAVHYLEASPDSGARQLPRRRAGRHSSALAPYRGQDLSVSRGALHTGSLMSPRIGDVRITYQVASPSAVSVVARQHGKRFLPFQTRSGDSLHLVETGYQGAAAMFASAHFANTVRGRALPAGTPMSPAPDSYHPFAGRFERGRCAGPASSSSFSA